MPFPSTSGSIPLTLEAAWEQARLLAATAKSIAQNTINTIASAGQLGADAIFYLPQQLNSINSQLTTIAGISGIAAYAQAQIANASENISQDFATMQAAITAASQWIVANFPVDSSGYLELVKWDANGNPTYQQFTSAQLSGLVTELNALIATIN